MKGVVFLVLIMLTFSFKAYGDVGLPYGLLMVELKNGETRHVKYHTHTGETWWSKGTVWNKITEPEKLLNSTYEYRISRMGNTWRLLRLDKLSGKAWKHSSGKWVPFSTRQK